MPYRLPDPAFVDHSSGDVPVIRRYASFEHVQATAIEPKCPISVCCTCGRRQSLGWRHGRAASERSWSGREVRAALSHALLPHSHAAGGRSVACLRVSMFWTHSRLLLS